MTNLSPDKRLMIATIFSLAVGLFFHFKKGKAPPLSVKGIKVWTKPVTQEMTEWAKSIVADPSNFPLGETVIREFDGVPVTARVEEHAWTYRNGVKVYGKFRGVTLYESFT